jgi:phosphoribosylanthranilate isomerase
MKVKICGIMSAEDAAMCEALGADALGFVHFPGKKRHMPLEKIAEIVDSLGPLVTSVVVCAPKSVAEALNFAKKSHADVIQSYSLSPKDIKSIGDQEKTVIRAVPPVRSYACKYAKVADALLFESGSPGTGTEYDYSKIPVDCCPKVIVGGGLRPDNIKKAKALRPYALDVSSGVESTPCRKDPALVAEFIRRCRE